MSTATLKTPDRLDWMTVGKEFVPLESDQAIILKEMEELEWQPLIDGMSLPMMQGSGIKETIKQLKIPKADAIAYGGGFETSVERGASYGLYGIQGHYKDCDIRLYVLDHGVGITPIVVEIFNK